MNGMEISRSYFETYGRPMLEEQFRDLLPYLAVGLAGAGSECLGFDDDVSKDHDFEPGFIIFLPGEDVVDRRQAFLLERAYAALPKEFRGLKRSPVQPAGGARHGVIRTADFFMEKTGTPDGRLMAARWLTADESLLSEAVNGEIWLDNYGEVTKIREGLRHYPRDIRLKKLAGSLFLMGQAGQYNYERCLSRGETGAAQMTVFYFVNHAMETIFLLNGVYQPFYKWSFRALRQLPVLSLDAELLEYLIMTDNEEGNREEKAAVMEAVARDVIEVLTEQGLTGASCGELEKHAFSVNDHIRNEEIRNLHILAAC